MFRLKIVLLSLVFSGPVLVGAALYFLSLMDKVGLDRIDREIMALGGSQLHALAPRQHWQNFDQSLRFIYGEERAKVIIVRIKNPWNDVIFQSDHWPEEISDAPFKDFDRTMDDAVIHNQDVVGGRPFPGALGGLPSGLAGDFLPNRVDGEVTRPFLPPNLGARERRAFPLLSADRDPQPAHETSPPAPEHPIKRQNVHIKKPFFQTITTPTGSWRVGIMGNQRLTILLGMNMAGYHQEAERLRKALLIAVPAALLLLAVGGWILAQRALKPIALITRTAIGINARELSQRIPQTDSDRELSRLVEVINTMLDRLQKSFEQAVRFSADAAHELQTPLTVLLGELDDAVQHAPLGSEEQQRYSVLLEEVQRLKVIVQKLLILARADAGKLQLRLEPVDLSALLGDAAEDLEVIAPHLRIDKQIEPQVLVNADPDLLGQVIQNLTANAVKYNIEKGMVRLQLATRGKNALLTIANSGKAIPVDERKKIFDRFYRVDKSRNRAIAGTGLGLSLAREITLAHGGDLRLAPASEDGLLAFVLTLPRHFSGNQLSE